MYNLSQFTDLDASLSRQKNKRETQFLALLEEAKLAFLDFCDFQTPEDLQDLTRLSLEALHYQRMRVEPYAFLAFAMFCAQAPSLGQKYLKIARELNPHFPLVEKIQTQLMRGH